MATITNVTFFERPSDLRRWLHKHHKSATELFLGYYKKDSGRPSITWPESVDEALCYGWIDGVRRSLDADSYVIRFTPRRPGSIWSNINTKRAQALIKSGRMHRSGLDAFKKRDPKRAGVYLFEQGKTPELKRAETATFKANDNAWKFFQAQPPGYRRLAVWWVIKAKQDATRARRLKTLIDDSAAGRRLGPMRRT